MFRQNVLSIVIELDVATMFDRGDGPLFAIVGETVTAGPLKVRLERYGRPDIKNILFLPNGFNSVNRDVDLHSNLRLGPIWVKSGTEIETGASFSLNLSANFAALSGESGLLFDCGLPGFDDGV